MRLLLIRHGKAEDADAFARTGRPDDERPLTDEGTVEMRAIAKGLAAAEPRIARIASSPLTRALQTADAIAERYPDAKRETIDALEPDANFADFVTWLRAQPKHALVAAVGHNPHLSELAQWLSSGDDDVDMKKGSALLLEFDDDIGAATGALRWYRKPRELMELADSR